MNGRKIVADTSLIINFFNGVDLAGKVMDQRQVWLSCISEIELLGFPDLSDGDRSLLQEFLDACVIVELTKSIRDITIDLRGKHRIKVPDGIIAATAIYLDIPLVTFDSDFKKINEINSVILT